MSEKFIPEQKEYFFGGMNNFDDPTVLQQHTYQQLINAYPGLTIKPNNGVKDIVHDDSQLGGISEVLEDTIFKPNAVWVNANEKDFIFIWNNALTTTTYFDLEIWNITDESRTRLIWGDFGSIDTHFSFTKLYNAIYITFNNEMTSNENSAYRTKNKIVEWDTATSAWVVREMGIDVAGSIGQLGIQDLEGMEFGYLSGHSIVFINGAYWCLGGQDENGDPNVNIYQSPDAKNWEYAAAFPDSYTIGMSIIVADIGFGIGESIICIGGQDGGGNVTDRVKVSNYGVGWVTRGTIPAVRQGHECVFFNNKLWVIAGRSTTNEVDTVYSSPDGITWTVEAVFPDTVNDHKALVYDNKIWVIGGYDLGASPTTKDDVYYTEDGVTWTLATGSAAFGFRRNHSAIVFRNKMWVVFGRNAAGTIYTDSYYSTDGITWTLAKSDVIPNKERLESTMFILQKEGTLIISGGDDLTTWYDDFYESEDGITYYSFNGLTEQLYYSYASTYIRRNDSDSVLSSYDDYVGSRWYDYLGKKIVGIDEKELTGTVQVSGSTMSGVGTLFTTECPVGSVIRVDGSDLVSTVITTPSDTSATISSSWAHAAGSKFSILPSLGDSISTDVWNTGIIEGIEDIENRKTIFVSTINKDTGQVYIPLPTEQDITDAVAQGATHIRIYRTLGNAVKATAQGLSHAFLIDIAITGDAFSLDKIFVDTIADGTLAGSTNYLVVTGYSTPPLGRYSKWAGDKLWIGGIEGEEGKWYHSVARGDIAFDTQFPQKFASLFNLNDDFVTCDPSDGQKDTGAALLGGDLYLFKERKIFVVFNSKASNDPFPVSSAIGCACPNTITNAYIPSLGGDCILFLSESGPAYISKGGNVALLNTFKIQDFWPKKTGVLQRSTGSQTDWYSRNKVSASFWDDTWWIFYGDSQDSNTPLQTNYCYGYRFSNDGISEGPFKKVFGLYTSEEVEYNIYEPQILIPIDNVRAYTLSHCDNFDDSQIYRLTQFGVPGQFLDKLFATIGLENLTADITVQQRRIYHNFQNDLEIGTFLKAIIEIHFDDTDGFEITINLDGTRLSSTLTYSENRQSGMTDTGKNVYRRFINAFPLESFQEFADYFDMKIVKTIPADGDLEIFNMKMLIQKDKREEEFSDGLGTPTGVTTYAEPPQPN